MSFTNLKTKKIKVALTGFIIIASVIFAWYPAMAHGPGGHGDNGFTSLQAARKGFDLYGKLITSQKLEKSWEEAFSAAKVSKRSINDATFEYVIKFTRLEGNPASVYIFLNETGEYRGSNFTGD